MEIQLFNTFKYVVGNSFVYKNKREVKVFFIYKNNYVIILPLMINKVKSHEDEQYYINEAKKIIAKMIKDGSLEKYAEKYIKDEKKKKILAILLPLVGACAIAGASIGIYYALNRPVVPGPIEPINEYFYIKNIGDTEASLTYRFESDDIGNFPDIHYSFDKKNWETLTVGTEILDHMYCTRTTIAPNKTIYYYGNNPNGLNIMGDVDDERFLSILGKVDDSGEAIETQDGKLAAGGNISSLLYGTKFKGRSDMPNFSYSCFMMFFSQNYNLVTAKDLFLPFTGPTVTSFAYMFYVCKNLEYAPTLWASDSNLSSELATQCYAMMFCYCPSLKEVRVNFSEWPTASGAALNMLVYAGVNVDSPIFYWKGPDDPDRTILPPDSTIPENWQVKHW